MQCNEDKNKFLIFFSTSQSCQRLSQVLRSSYLNHKTKGFQKRKEVFASDSTEQYNPIYLLLVEKCENDAAVKKLC